MAEGLDARRPDKPWIFRTYAGHSTARESMPFIARTWQKGRPAFP